MAFLNFLRSKAEDKRPLLEQCLSVDLEVNPKTAEIFDMAAVRFGNGPAVVAPKGRSSRGSTNSKKRLRRRRM
jgi:ATP-dependent DNA helicase RecQ